MELTKALNTLLLVTQQANPEMPDDVLRSLYLGLEAIEEIIKLRNASAGYSPPRLLHETKEGDD